MGILEDMLKIQDAFAQKFGFHPSPAQLGTAITGEGIELWENEGKSTEHGKWWKNPVDDLETKQKFEAIDILHFLLQLFNELGMTEEEILRMYHTKMKINHERQRDDY